MTPEQEAVVALALVQMDEKVKEFWDVLNQIGTEIVDEISTANPYGNLLPQGLPAGVKGVVKTSDVMVAIQLACARVIVYAVPRAGKLALNEFVDKKIDAIAGRIAAKRIAGKVPFIGDLIEAFSAGKADADAQAYRDELEKWIRREFDAVKRDLVGQILKPVKGRETRRVQSRHPKKNGKAS